MTEAWFHLMLPEWDSSQPQCMRELKDKPERHTMQFFPRISFHFTRLKELLQGKRWFTTLEISGNNKKKHLKVQEPSACTHRLTPHVSGITFTVWLALLQIPGTQVIAVKMLITMEPMSKQARNNFLACWLSYLACILLWLKQSCRKRGRKRRSSSRFLQCWTFTSWHLMVKRHIYEIYIWKLYWLQSENSEILDLVIQTR